MYLKVAWGGPRSSDRNSVPQPGIRFAGPLHNLGHALELPKFALGRWVAQGGFAGEGVVPSELQMEKPSAAHHVLCVPGVSCVSCVCAATTQRE